MKRTHGEVLLLVKLQASACNFTKSNTFLWFFSRFLNFTNAIKSRKASHMLTDNHIFSMEIYPNKSIIFCLCKLQKIGKRKRITERYMYETKITGFGKLFTWG